MAATGLMMYSLKHDPHDQQTRYITDHFRNKTGREMSEIYIGMSLASLVVITPVTFGLTGVF